MKKKVGMTLDEIGEMLGFVVEHMATKEDLAELRRELKADIAGVKEDVVTIKADLFDVHVQVNSIEAEIRGMKQERLEVRVADLEEKVFGRTRS